MAYDSAIITFTTKTDKVDLVQAAHMNAVQNELVILETILGTNLKGTAADLATRISKALDTDGSLLSGTAFPSPALPSQGFFRTDLDAFYLRNAANTAWLAQQQTFSNVLFCYMGSDLNTNNAFGEYVGTSLIPTISSTSFNYRYLAVSGDTVRTLLVGRFSKIAGINTITIHAKLWASNTDANKEVILTVDVGGQSNTVKSTTSSTPSWVTPATIDVSGLTNGTVYDITIKLNNETTGYPGYCSGIILTGS